MKGNLRSLLLAAGMLIAMEGSGTGVRRGRRGRPWAELDGFCAAVPELCNFIGYSCKIAQKPIAGFSPLVGKGYGVFWRSSSSSVGKPSRK